MYLPDEEFKKIANEIIKTGKPIKISPKRLIEHFGTSRRKTNVKYWIDRALSDLKLKTEPDYKSEYLYGEVLLKQEKKKAEQEDFIQRLKLLDAANTIPVYVTKNDSLQKAMTLMMTHDYSQLPVMNSPKSSNLDGLISWHSIGWTTAKGKEILKVGDCISSDLTVLNYETPMLEAVHVIKEKEVILVKKKDGGISGLVTITDIADEFFNLAEPFLYIGQIETSLRVLLEDRFELSELQSIQHGDSKREIYTVSDLTFSEYIQLLRKGENWDKIELPLDRDEFTKKLDEVREIRNEVMHFSSDRIEPEQYLVLKQTAQFLKEILIK